MNVRWPDESLKNTYDPLPSQTCACSMCMIYILQISRATHPRNTKQSLRDWCHHSFQLDKLTVRLGSGGDGVTCDLPEEKWASLVVIENWALSASRISGNRWEEGRVKYILICVSAWCHHKWHGHIPVSWLHSYSESQFDFLQKGCCEQAKRWRKGQWVVDQ